MGHREHQGEGLAFWMTIQPLAPAAAKFEDVYNMAAPTTRGTNNEDSLYCKGLAVQGIALTTIGDLISPASTSYARDCSVASTGEPGACPDDATTADQTPVTVAATTEASGVSKLASSVVVGTMSWMVAIMLW